MLAQEQGDDPWRHRGSMPDPPAVPTARGHLSRHVDMAFHSFIRDPRPEERFLASWSLPKLDQNSCPLRDRIARLSRRLYLPYQWANSESSNAEAWENPNIPAGYTYLAQFLAHDTVQSSISTSGLRRRGETLRNGRSAPLELQTLYGSGFDGCLTALTDQDRHQLSPSKLHLGKIRIGDNVDSRCPFRDIPRSLPVHTTADSEGLQKVSIADDRNDNNVFVSQTTMLFALFHNTVVDILHAGNRKRDTQTQSYFADLFYDAKDICIQTYRRIVRNDLLRRLLHPDVFAHYESGSPRYLDPRPDVAITFEFTHLLRFGHAMVRPHYRVNDMLQRREELIDVLLTTSRGRPWRMPLDESWPIRWSKFYPISDSKPNLSRRIGPQLSPDLVSALVFESIDETNCVGLAYRDLLTGISLPIWSVTALVAEIEAVFPELVATSRLLSDRRHREAALADWLSSRTNSTGLTRDDIMDISRDPPLLLFALFESAHDMRGERLGILGSIVIGEPIFKVLARGSELRNGLRVADEKSQPSSDELRAAQRENQLTSEFSEILGMSDLITFVRRRSAIDESIVPFV